MSEITEDRLRQMANIPEARSRFDELTEAQKLSFLDHLAEHGNATRAAKQVGVKPNTARYWRANDPDFCLLWDEAIEQVADSLEEKGLARAEDGSDRLLEFFLKSHRPRRYRESIKLDIDQRTTLVMDLSGISGGTNESV